MVRFPKIEGVIMTATAVILNLVLLFSVVARYHHHDKQGDVHYCFVCDFDDAVNHCKYWGLQGIGCCGDQGSDHDDEDCALHIDSFYHDDSHYNCRHHCSIHYICACLHWVAILNENCITDLILFDSIKLDVPAVHFASQVRSLTEETRGPPSIS